MMKKEYTAILLLLVIPVLFCSIWGLRVVRLADEISTKNGTVCVMDEDGEPVFEYEGEYKISTSRSTLKVTYTDGDGEKEEFQCSLSQGYSYNATSEE